MEREDFLSFPLRKEQGSSDWFPLLSLIYLFLSSYRTFWLSFLFIGISPTRAIRRQPRHVSTPVCMYMCLYVYIRRCERKERGRERTRERRRHSSIQEISLLSSLSLIPSVLQLPSSSSSSSSFLSSSALLSITFSVSSLHTYTPHLHSLAFFLSFSSFAGVFFAFFSFSRCWCCCCCMQFGSKSHAECVAFSPDGEHLVSGSIDGFVEVWDWTSGTLNKELSYQKEVRNKLLHMHAPH